MLLIIEAKSGSLSDAALSGRKAALKQDLLRLLGRSTQQANRLTRALRDGESVSFAGRATGEPIVVDLVGVRRFHSVVVTLDDLSPVAMRPERLVEARILTPEDPVPWCVSLFDLEVIAHSTQFPAQLTSYLDARAHIDPRAEWPGEDDLWMTHLLARLDFDRVDHELFMVDGRTDLLTDQWLLQRPPPRADLPKATKKQLRKLSRLRPSGWLAHTEDLLDQAMQNRRPRVTAPVQP